MGAHKKWEPIKRFHRDTDTPDEVSLTLTKAGEVIFSCCPPEDVKAPVSDMHLLLAGAAVILCNPKGRDLFREAFAAVLEDMRNENMTN